MKLNSKELLNREAWEQNGFKLPKYDRKQLIENTYNNPTWLHFGAGNIFRAFPARCLQKLISQ